MVGNGGCKNSFGREISREKCPEIGISRDAGCRRDSRSEVEISRAKCSGVETSRE